MNDLTVLVIDDNESNLILAEAILEVHGFEVRTAVDAPTAMETLAKWKPRLILMDLQLPEMDGLDLTRRLKADPANKDIMIVAVTAYAMREDEEKALAAGCDGYVAKPLNTRKLPGYLKDLLAKKR